MKRIVQIFLLLGSVCSALAQGYIFSPPTAPTVEGNSSMFDPFMSSSFRYQQVYAGSQFGAGTAYLINGISFRLDGATLNNPSMFFGGGSVTLSITPRAPDSLSLVFDENVGNNAVTIFNGAFSFGGMSQPGAIPQSFRETFIATRPFLYDPAQGNLLLDIAGFGGQTFIPGSLDAQFATGDPVSRVYALNGNALSGMSDSLGLVTRFGFTAVPEPSTWALSIIGFVLLFLLKPKRG